MTSIRKLPQDLVNKIAAGEVVERPASVVKELLENAIDSGARRLILDVESGGKELIRITDDGWGIEKEELPLALSPHATSKITSEDDLFQLDTLGFRGEALASIASVSEMTLSSRVKGSPQGFRLLAEEGAEVEPCAMTVGTIVEVRRLFYHSPGRRKFLKKDSTEFRHILDIATKTSLAYPEVAFTLNHNGKQIFHLESSQDLRERIAHFFDREMAEELIRANFTIENYQVQGWLAPPRFSRRDTTWQYTYLNHRYIRDKLLQAAIREAYRDVVMKGRHPVLFLFLQVPADLVDVNVHPRKLEVRFLEERTVFKVVYNTLRENMDIPDIVPPFEGQSPRRSASSPPSQNYSQATPSTGGRSTSYSPPDRPSPGLFSPSPQRSTTGPGSSSMFPSREEEVREETSSIPLTEGENSSRDEMLAHVSRVFQIHNTYIIAEVPDGIRIIDQHALHEKILLMKLRKNYGKSVVEIQNLLIPEEVELSLEEMAQFEEHREIFAKMGFKVEVQGENLLVIKAYPALLEGNQWSRFFKDGLCDLARQEGDKKIDMDEVLATMSCKGAIKAGKKLSEDEIFSLIQQSLAAPHTYTCAHGRPTYLSMTMGELDYKFGRNG